MRALTRRDRRLLLLAALVTLATGLAHGFGVAEVATFVIAAGALGLLATVVGRSVDALGDRLGAGATGVIHAALGNLPELFFGIFALRAGLVEVVQATIVGSVLSTVLLVLGVAFFVGGRRHGTQRFDGERGRGLIVLLLLAIAVIAVPTLTSALHTPAARHEGPLSMLCALLLLGVFVVTLPDSLKRAAGGGGHTPDPDIAALQEAEPAWPLALALGVLAGSSVAAALVSDWFVAALTPATRSLGISEPFAGLVIVAIAGNAVENVVGIGLAARNRTDYALSVVLNSPLQILLVLLPALVLLSYVVGAPQPLTLSLPPLLLGELVIAGLTTAFVVYDGESTWVEGTALGALYVACAGAFWWG